MEKLVREKLAGTISEKRLEEQASGRRLLNVNANLHKSITEGFTVSLMVRRLDEGKIKRVIRCLIRHREGIWLRNLARECRLSVSTASFYVDNVLKDVVESIGVKDLSLIHI